MRLKKMVSVILVVAMCMSIGGTTLAVSDHIGITPFWFNTSSIYINCYIYSDGCSENSVIITGQPGTTNIAGKMTLERGDGYGNYTTIKTWTYEQAGQRFEWGAYWYVSRGYIYRLTVNATVTRNGVDEYVAESYTREYW